MAGEEFAHDSWAERHKAAPQGSSRQILSGVGPPSVTPIVAKVLAGGASFIGVYLIRRTIVFA